MNGITKKSYFSWNINVLEVPEKGVGTYWKYKLSTGEVQIGIAIFNLQYSS